MPGPSAYSPGGLGGRASHEARGRPRRGQPRLCSQGTRTRSLRPEALALGGIFGIRHDRLSTSVRSARDVERRRSPSIRSVAPTVNCRVARCAVTPTIGCRSRSAPCRRRRPCRADGSPVEDRRKPRRHGRGRVSPFGVRSPAGHGAMTAPAISDDTRGGRRVPTCWTGSVVVCARADGGLRESHRREQDRVRELRTCVPSCCRLRRQAGYSSPS